MTSAGAVHLLGRLNLALVWEANREELRGILGQPEQKKVIVWDETLIGPVGMVAEVQFLRQLGVYKMVRLPVPNLTEQYPEASEFLFFTRPRLHLVDQILDAIKTSSKKQSKKFVVVFVPNKAQHCIHRFKEFGLEHDTHVPVEFRIMEFHLDLLPLDSDVLSLDMPSAFTDLYVDHDPSPLYQAARAICKLQAVYGVIPRIYGKGKNAQAVAEQLVHMRQELFPNASSMKDLPPQIDAVILLDRSVDLLTPLSTQLTYEGLIDEIYGINHGCAKFPRQMFSEDVQVVPKGAPPPTGPLPVLLNSEESLFAETRDLNFRAVGHYLAREAKKITQAFQERHDAKTVSQLKQFVQKLPHMQQSKQSLSKHTTIAELVKNITDKMNFLKQVHVEQGLREEEGSDRPEEYIEGCMGMLEPVEKTMRLMCMQSVANSGLKPKLLEYYKKSVLQAYGYEHLVTLHNLEKAGLLRPQESRTFPVMRKALRLIADNVDELQPKDISYVFSGYAPLSIRLVELLERPNGWSNFEEVTRPLAGPAVNQTQPVARGQEKRKRPTPDHPQIVLVFFLGGCTYAEISALRFLSQREDATTEYIVGTTHITSGHALISDILTETPGYRPTPLWDNQLDEPPPPPEATGRPRR